MPKYSVPCLFPVIQGLQTFLNEWASYFHRSFLHTLDPFDKIPEILVYMPKYPTWGCPKSTGLFHASSL